MEDSGWTFSALKTDDKSTQLSFILQDSPLLYRVETLAGLYIGDILIAEGGCWVFWPVLRGGYWPSWGMVQIAYKIDCLNKELSEASMSQSVKQCTYFSIEDDANFVGEI